MMTDATTRRDPISNAADDRRRAALANPARVYDRPTDVLDDPALDDRTRRRILRGWALDERRLMVSTGENMAGGRANRLADVVAALRTLESEGPAPDDAS